MTMKNHQSSWLEASEPYWSSVTYLRFDETKHEYI